MNKKEKTPKPNYDLAMQKLYIEMFLSDAETFIRCQNIFDPYRSIQLLNYRENHYLQRLEIDS